MNGDKAKIKQEKKSQNPPDLSSVLTSLLNALNQNHKLTHLSFCLLKEIARPDSQNALPPSVSLSCVAPVCFPVTPAPNLFPYWWLPPPHHYLSSYDHPFSSQHNPVSYDLFRWKKRKSHSTILHHRGVVSAQ